MRIVPDRLTSARTHAHTHKRSRTVDLNWAEGEEGATVGRSTYAPGPAMGKNATPHRRKGGHARRQGYTDRAWP